MDTHDWQRHEQAGTRETGDKLLLHRRVHWRRWRVGVLPHRAHGRIAPHALVERATPRQKGGVHRLELLRTRWRCKTGRHREGQGTIPTWSFLVSRAMFRHGSSAEPPGSSGTPIAVPFQPTTRVGLSGFAEDNAARERRAREAEVKAAQASNARTQEQTRQLALERREQDRQKLVAQKAKGDGKDRERTDREVDQYRETDKKQRQNKKAAEEGMRARLSASPVKTALPRPGTKTYGSTGVHKQFKVSSMTSVGGNGPVVMKGKAKAREEEEEIDEYVSTDFSVRYTDLCAQQFAREAKTLQVQIQAEREASRDGYVRPHRLVPD